MVSIEAISAEQVNISWIAGLDGGSKQTFTVLLKETKLTEEILYYTDHLDTEPGALLYFLLSNLKPQTEYDLSVASINEFNGSSQATSNVIRFSTRGEKNILHMM